jgi:hypothetical protein
MQKYQVEEARTKRAELYAKMSIDTLYLARNQWLERQDSGMAIDKTALQQINAELKRRGENV